MQLKFVYNDGGRAAAGYSNKAKGDCVVRAIAIASGRPYQQVYDDLNKLAQSERLTKRFKKRSNSEKGVHRKTFEKYIHSIGGAWYNTMGIGTGCTTHLVSGELPNGRLIVKVSKHLTAVIDQVINDLYDPSRDGTRCVYGYYKF